MRRSLRITGALVVAAACALPACSDAEHARGSEEVASEADADDVRPSPDADGADAEAQTAPCDPGSTACTRGVIAECDDDGRGWTYHSCPRGEICEGDGCVPNRALVQIVASSPAPPYRSGWGDTPVDPTLAVQVVEDWESTNSACGSYLQDQLLESGSDRHAEMALIEKYWIRRLVRDLEGDPLDLMLMGPPTGRPGELQPGCQSLDSLASPSECVGGEDRLWSGKRFDEANDAALSSLHDPDWIVSDLTAGELDWDAFDALVQPMVKVGPDGTAADILPWVDGRFETQQGGPCEVDADCGDGWCIDGRCERVVNPELNLTPTWINIVRGRMAYLALAGVARPEGRPCEVDADCGRSVYRCRDGRCRDPAAPCRVRDTVLVAHFGAIPPGWGTGFAEKCELWRVLQSGLDLHYARWMRWGCACDADTPCVEGATCRDICWTVPEGSEFCPSGDTVCVPDPLFKYYWPAPNPFGILANILTAYTCESLPSPKPRDVAGRPFLTRIHTILTQDSGDSKYGGHLTATATAYMAEGVAVTPCGGVEDPREANISPMLISHMVSCDYETRYQQLVERLRTHARNVVCTRDDVGLPASSATLIR